MENKKEFREWLDAMNLSHPIIISGPCSAETEEQVLKTAHQIKKTKTNVFRAGIWKPRTRPGGFEGVGEKGLPWLKKVKEETGLLITTEVGNAYHIEKALQYDVDILWIGARTTVNPFAIQEISNALKGVDKIVLIKNPVNPDLSLWMGAVERIYNSGISQLGVIHRGFSAYNSRRYRNKPQWHIAIELKKELPDLPLIIDPSHICGRRDTILEVLQTALDLSYDGLMIETHIDPDKAWSDSEQQIAPNQLTQIIKNLKIRKKSSSKEAFQHKLNLYRDELDVIDHHLIDVLKERMSVSEEIGKLKYKENVAILQSERWAELLKEMIDSGQKNELSNEFIEQLFRTIHMESIKVQHDLINTLVKE